MVPTDPAPGVKEVMAGVFTGNVMVPQGETSVTCVITPLAGRLAVSCVELTIVRLEAA